MQDTKLSLLYSPTHSLSDYVETVKRVISHIGGPTILVGHSYGAEVITNAAYNNPNVTGLVYIAAFAPDEGQSLSSFVDPSKFPKELFLVDSGGFITSTRKFSEKILLKMLIRLKLILWQLCRSPLTNQSLRGEVWSSRMETITNMVSNL